MFYQIIYRHRNIQIFHIIYLCIIYFANAVCEWSIVLCVTCLSPSPACIAATSAPLSVIVIVPSISIYASLYCNHIILTLTL